MPRSSLLNPHPPEAGEVPEPPLQTPMEGFQLVLTGLWILSVFNRVGQGYCEYPPFIGPEGSPVDTSHAPQELPTARPGESLDPSPGSSTFLALTTLPTPPIVVEAELG